jgi:hypothetical protein
MHKNSEEEYKNRVIAHDQLIERLQSIYVTAKIYPKVFSDPELHKYHKYFDRILFAILSQLDLQIGLKNLYHNGYNQNDIEARYFARIVALSSYEILYNLDKFLDRKIKDYIKKTMGVEALKSIQVLLTDLSAIKDSKGKMLNEIRHNTVAHKEKDAVRQAEIITSIDPLVIHNVGYAIHEILLKLISKFVELLKIERNE